MSYSRSRFYNYIYTPLRDARYDEALNYVTRYSVRTRSAAFRKIYDPIIKTLDVIKQDVIKRGGTADKSRLLFQLARLDIMIEYQKNRGVLDADLADGIKAALAEIRRDLGADKAAREAEALELALNAVLAYQIAAERRRGEEEWL
jgi:CRISPR/Cas system CSM-associated protein Csm2 small subunit